ncbi:MAG: helix-turn-helix transcriptional regulator [Chloroflexia bacterium]
MDNTETFDETQTEQPESADDAKVAQSLSQAIVSVMRARRMTATNVANRMRSGRNRATLYRILSGSTQDPKVSTFVDICYALDVSPIEVLQLAGAVPHQARDTDLIEIRMRQIFRRVQAMPLPAKRLTVSQFDVLAEVVAEHESFGEDVPDGDPSFDQDALIPPPIPSTINDDR